MHSWSPEQWTMFLGALGLVCGSVIAAMATAAVKIIAAMQGVSGKVDALEIKVDGRLTQLLAQTAAASSAEGRELGRGEMIVPALLPVGAEVKPVEVPFDPNAEKLVIALPEPVPTVVLVPMPAKEEKPDLPAPLKDFKLSPPEKEKP